VSFIIIFGALSFPVLIASSLWDRWARQVWPTSCSNHVRIIVGQFLHVGYARIISVRVLQETDTQLPALFDCCSGIGHVASNLCSCTAAVVK